VTVAEHVIGWSTAGPVVGGHQANGEAQGSRLQVE